LTDAVRPLARGASPRLPAPRSRSTDTHPAGRNESSGRAPS
jgi:hypothetical protein